MSRFQDYFNEKTGEQASGMLVIKGARYPSGLGFVTVFDGALCHLASRGLSRLDWQVLMALIGQMAFGNWVVKSQKTIAIELGLAPSNLSTTIRRLCGKQLLARLADPNDGGRKVLRVSLHICWRGNAKQWVTAINRGEGTMFDAVMMPSVRINTAAR